MVLRKSKKTHLDLLPAEWTAAESLIIIINNDLEAVNQTLCGESYVTLSWVLPMMHGLINKTLQAKDEDILPIPAVKKNMRENISRRFAMDQLTADYIDLLASALDPRFRHMLFMSLHGS